MYDVWRKYISENPTWENVTFLYIKFLEGVIPATPLHHSPLVADTNDKGIHQLIQMNRLGFVTVDSQPGVCTNFVNPTNNKSGKERQRQYISGYILKSLYEKFTDDMAKHSDIAFLVVDANGDYIKTHYPKWVDSEEDIVPLTVAKFDDDKEFEVETSMPINDYNYFPNKDAYGPYFSTDFDIKFFDDLHKWIVENTVYISLFAEEYCNPNVMNDVIIDLLKSAQ